MSPIANQREITATVTLEPGNYVIVPSTKLPNLEGRFWITVYIPNATSSKVLLGFSDPDAKRDEAPKKIPDPYEVVPESYQQFIEKRKKYFLFTQIISKAEHDASFNIDSSPVADRSSAQKQPEQP